MEFNLRDILTVTTILFAVIDVVGSIPVLLEVKKRVGHIKSFQATLVSMFIMIGFLFLGETLLNFLGVDVQSFAIAGSLVIFFLALEMILGIRLYKDEIPFSVYVDIEEFIERSSAKDYLRASIIVERDTQKAIIIGANGAGIKQLGESSRRDIEEFLGRKVYLELFVKTKKDWKNDEDFLKRNFNKLGTSSTE